MSILLGLSNLFGALADTIEYGPAEAVKINTSFSPEAERSYRKIMKDLEKESNKTDVAISNTDSSDSMGIISKVVSDMGKQKSTEDIVDEAEEEAIRKAVEEKSCW